MKRPALFILMYTVIAILFGLYYIIPQVLYYFLATIFFISIIIIIYFKNFYYILLIAAGMISFMFTVTADYHKDRELTKMADRDFPVAIEAVVSDCINQYDNTTLYKITTESIKFKEHSSTEKINMYMYTNKNLKIGDVIKTKSVLFYGSKKRNESEYSQAVNFFVKKIEYKLYPEKLSIIGHKDTFMSFCHNLSYKVQDQIYKIYNKKDAGIITAMLLGDRQDLDEEIYSLYSLAGIVHIIAISGLHISIFCGILFAILKPLGPKLSSIVILLFLIFYSIFTGCSVSVLRASIMTAFYIFSGLLGRKYDLLSSTAMACSILLLYNPYNLYDLGFQYSFTAVFVIGFSSEIFKKYKLKNKFLLLFLTSLAVTLATKPLTIYNFYYINFIDVFVNIIAITLMEVILVFSLISILISFIYIKVGVLLAYIPHLFLTIIEYTAKLSLKLPFSHIETGGISFLMLVLLYIALFLIYKFFINKKLFAIPLIICIITVGTLAVNKYDGFETIFFYDGQGDCAIIKEKDKCYFIDAGSSQYSPRGKKILNQLKYENIKKINGIYISHMDYDHLGAVFEIAGNIDIEKLILSKYCKHNDNYNKLIETAAKNNIEVVYVDENYSENITASGKIELVAVDKNASSTNNRSPIYKVTSNGKSILFTGDMDAKTEEKFLNYDIDADVLKVPHHGAEGSVSEKFIKAVSPELAVCSAGYLNKYEHPSDKALETYKNMNVPFFSTEYNGAVRVKLHNNKISYSLPVAKFYKDATITE